MSDGASRTANSSKLTLTFSERPVGLLPSNILVDIGSGFAPLVAPIVWTGPTTCEVNLPAASWANGTSAMVKLTGPAPFGFTFAAGFDDEQEVFLYRQYRNITWGVAADPGSPTTSLTLTLIGDMSGITLTKPDVSVGGVDDFGLIKNNDNQYTIDLVVSAFTSDVLTVSIDNPVGVTLDENSKTVNVNRPDTVIAWAGTPVASNGAQGVTTTTMLTLNFDGADPLFSFGTGDVLVTGSGNTNISVVSVSKIDDDTFIIGITGVETDDASVTVTITQDGYAVAPQTVTVFRAAYQPFTATLTGASTVTSGGAFTVEIEIEVLDVDGLSTGGTTGVKGFADFWVEFEWYLDGVLAPNLAGGGAMFTTDPDRDGWDWAMGAVPTDFVTTDGFGAHIPFTATTYTLMTDGDKLTFQVTFTAPVLTPGQVLELRIPRILGLDEDYGDFESGCNSLFVTAVAQSLVLKSQFTRGFRTDDDHLGGTDVRFMYLEARKTVADVKAMFENPAATIEVIQQRPGAFVGTGSIVRVLGGDFEVVIIVKGDTNGDGTVTSGDYQRVGRHCLGITRLTGAFLLAAKTGTAMQNQVNVTSGDYLRIGRHFLGGTSLYANIDPS
jgi:hypothetical protein